MSETVVEEEYEDPDGDEEKVGGGGTYKSSDSGFFLGEDCGEESASSESEAGDDAVYMERSTSAIAAGW